MPLPQIVTRLKNALSVYGKTAKAMSVETGLDEHMTNAIHVLLYMNTYKAFLEQNKASIPDDEFNLLIGTIERLKPYEAANSNPWRSRILGDLVSLLITTHDLLIQRNPDSNHFSEIMQMIEQLPGTMLHDLNIPPSSTTGNFIREQGTLIGPVEGDILSKETILEKAKNNYYLNHRIDDLNHRIDDLNLINISPSLTDDALLASLKSLILVYAFSAPQFVKEDQVMKLIETFFQQFDNSEQFVKIFLDAYQEVYQEFKRKDGEINTLLKGVPVFLPMFDQLLPPNKLSELLAKKIETGFLNDPSASEHDDSYVIYEVCLSFYADLADTKGDYTAATQRSREELYPILNHQQFLYPHLQVAGRNASDSIRLFTSDPLNKLPPIMQMDLVEIFKNNQGLQVEFESFIHLFIRVNSQADTHQQRNIKLMFTQNEDAVVEIIKIMGIEGIRYLRSQLAGTVLTLERTLAYLPILPEKLQNSLQEYCNDRALSFRENPKDIQAMTTSMIILDLLIGMDDDNGDVDNYLKIPVDKSPEEYMLSLARTLLDKVFLGIQVTLSAEEITTILNRVPPEKIVPLIVSSKKMSESDYRDVYLHLLKMDLLGGDINGFLHNTDQTDEIGEALAYHNKLIQDKLTTCDIDPDTALNYQKTLDFSVTLSNDEANVNSEVLHLTISSYIKQLTQEIENIKNIHDNPELNRLKTAIDKLHTANPDFKVVGKTVKDALGEINTSLNTLAKKASDFPPKFNEFSEHVRAQYKLIKDSKIKAKEIKTYEFSVEQWKKDNIGTFFLGDEVGCCLATTGAQFQAIVQRRMDDALLFHVAIDKKTGRPAALIWLYLAETDDKKIALVANFFEVNAKYATNESLRLALLNGLLEFTHIYCKDNPHISAFYMNKLSYGWNINDLNQYDMQSVTLSDKLGGPFVPGMPVSEIMQLNEQLAENPELSERVKAHTQEKYYLVSLSQTQFHKFDPAKLNFSNTNISPTPIVPQQNPPIANEKNKDVLIQISKDFKSRVKSEDPNEEVLRRPHQP